MTSFGGRPQCGALRASTSTGTCNISDFTACLRRDAVCQTMRQMLALQS